MKAKSYREADKVPPNLEMHEDAKKKANSQWGSPKTAPPL